MRCSIASRPWTIRPSWHSIERPELARRRCRGVGWGDACTEYRRLLGRLPHRSGAAALHSRLQRHRFLRPDDEQRRGYLAPAGSHARGQRATARPTPWPPTASCKRTGPRRLPVSRISVTGGMPPGRASPTRGTTPTTSIVRNGTSIAASVKPYTNGLIKFTSAADVVTITATSPFSRLHEADGKNIDRPHGQHPILRHPMQQVRRNDGDATTRPGHGLAGRDRCRDRGGLLGHRRPGDV